MNVDGDSEALSANLEAEFRAAIDAGQKLRAEAMVNPTVTLKSGRVVLDPRFAQADAEIRRAVGLAKAIRLERGDSPESVDARFADLDAHPLGKLYEYRKGA